MHINPANTLQKRNLKTSFPFKISPSECTKFLGIFIDNKLSFNSHVNSLVSKCNARLFLMRKLKTFGLNNDGLKTFYVSNIRSVMSYAAPAWYTLLSNTNKQRLERLQRSATRIITPDMTMMRGY